MEMLAYKGLQELLFRLGVNQGAAEYHGALCGMLCHGDPRPDSLVFDEMKDDDQAKMELVSFSRDSLKKLKEPEFAPLLPEDEESLPQRVESLAAWCGGFLYGLGTAENLDIGSLSEEGRELVRDFTEISRAGLELDEQAGEEEERAYAELVEYVRVGAQVLFLELHPQSDETPAPGQMPGNETLH